MAFRTKHSLAFPGAALALAFFPVISSPAFAQTSPDKQCPGDQALRADLASFISDLYRVAYPEAVAPGMAVAIIRRDCDVLSRSYGYADLAAKRPIDADTSFYIASSTKPFVGLAAQLLPPIETANWVLQSAELNTG